MIKETKRKPFEWLTKESRQFLENGYVEDGDKVEERISFIADNAEKVLGISGFADKFYDYMSRGWFSLSSPVWSNFGLKRGLPISCFGSYIGDSIAEINFAVSEVAMMSKLGGGTSGYFGDIRPRGADINNNGTTNGSFPFARAFDTTVDVVSQGSTRRGRFSPYIDIEHPDILEWLDIGLEGNPIQELQHGICVGDKWLEEMKAGDSDKRKVWAKLIQCRGEIGYPYVFYKDNVNNNTVDVYKDKGMKIHASNLCMTGDQRVVTDKGYLTAKELYEKDLNVSYFSGEDVVKGSLMKLREKEADVYRITLGNGLEHKVTSYHGIPVLDEKNNIVRVACEDLKVGDKVAIQTKKGIFGKESNLDKAFLLGLYQSDGTQYKNNRYIDVWENDFDLLEEIEQSLDSVYKEYGFNEYGVINQTKVVVGKRSVETPKFTNCKVNTGDVLKKRIQSSKLHKLGFNKGVVPSWIWESNEETQWAYLRGLLIADGTVFMSSSKGNPIQLSYSDINKDFLKQLQLIFNNLGLHSSIRLLRKGGETLLPDGKGGKKIYKTKDCYRLVVGTKKACLEIEKNTKFLSRKGVSLEGRVYRDNSKSSWFHEGYDVISIDYVGKEDVYCPTIDTDDHIFVAQGLKTFNCTEIMLPSSQKESFVCCLSSMNLLHYDEWKDTDAVETMTHFLDAVMEEFITKLEAYRDSEDFTDNLSFSQMERTYNFAKNHRALGIGVVGWHSLLQSKMIPFESFDAMQLNTRVFKSIQEQAYEASKNLADMFGEPELLKGYGRRNTTLTAIAPTKSSSFVLGQVSLGIEPIKSNIYVKDLAKIKTTVKNRFLTNLLEEKGMDTKDVWRDIRDKDGSVQHLDFLSDHEKDVFKTWFELSQLSLVQQASSRQKYICQAQSLNLAVHPSTPTKEVNKLMMTAHELGVKSLYYQENISAAQQFKRELNDCASCEG